MCEHTTVNSGLAVHCYHDSLFDRVYDLDDRVKYFKEHKPKEEQELRLKLLQLIPDTLIPGKNSAEWHTYLKAWDAYRKAEDAFLKAWDAYLKAFGKELEKLHKELCPDCPWDGHTIFTRKDKNGNWY